MKIDIKTPRASVRRPKEKTMPNRKPSLAADKLRPVVRRAALMAWLRGAGRLSVARRFGITARQVEAIIREGWTPRRILRKRGWTLAADGLMHPPNATAHVRAVASNVEQIVGRKD